jgi:small subunit ribosomal protein S21
MENSMATKPNVTVIVGKDEPIEKALRKFKRLCEKQGIKKQVKARRYYEKPSEARRREVRKGERNRRKNQRKSQEDARGRKKDSRNWMFNHPKLSENA